MNFKRRSGHWIVDTTVLLPANKEKRTVLDVMFMVDTGAFISVLTKQQFLELYGDNLTSVGFAEVGGFEGLYKKMPVYRLPAIIIDGHSVKDVAFVVSEKVKWNILGLNVLENFDLLFRLSQEPPLIEVSPSRVLRDIFVQGTSVEILRCGEVSFVGSPNEPRVFVPDLCDTQIHVSFFVDTPSGRYYMCECDGSRKVVAESNLKMFLKSVPSDAVEDSSDGGAVVYIDGKPVPNWVDL